MRNVKTVPWEALVDSLEEIVQERGMKIEELEAALRKANAAIQTLTLGLNEGQATWRKLWIKQIRQVLRGPQEHLLWEMYRPWNRTKETRTFRETGKELGITESHARSIHNAAVGNIARFLWQTMRRDAQ
jgi:hypothetical protein